MARRRRRRASIRRRSFRRRRAAPRRRRSRRSRARGDLGRLHPKSAFTQGANIAGVLAFFSQLTGKDRAAGAYPALATTTDKAKIFANNVFGRIIGFQPFTAQSNPAFVQTINLDGAVNKFTGIGLGALIYGALPFRMLPHKGKAKTLGKRLLTAGVLGGIFDAPGNSTATVQVQSAPRLIQSSGQQVSTS